MKRVIKTYENCGDEILQELAKKFPNGIKPRHISKIPTIKGDLMKVIELQLNDCIYLIKFNAGLEKAIDDVELQFGLTTDEDDEDLIISADENDLEIPVVNDDKLVKELDLSDSIIDEED